MSMQRTPPHFDNSKDMDLKSGTNVTTRQNKRPRKGSNNNSSIESSPEKSNDKATHQPVITPDLIRDIVRTELRSLLTTDIRKIVQESVRAELKDIRSELNVMRDSLDFTSKQYDDMKLTLEEKSKQIDQLQKENNSMKPIIKDMTFRLTQMEQHARSCNIEILSVPEYKSENLNVTMMQLCKVISCPLKENDIVMSTRIAKHNPEGARPRSIIVKLTSPAIRDEILAAVIKFNKANVTNKLNTAHLGIGGEKRPVYVAEHLAPQNRSLHHATRMLAKEKNYKFVWVRNGRIFAKKCENSERLLISDMDSLVKLV